MKTGFLIIFGAALTVLLTVSDTRADQVISFKTAPTGISDYLELQAQVNSPEGAAGLFVMAMLTREKSPQLSRAFMTLSLAEDLLEDGPNGYKGRQPNPELTERIDHLTKHPEIARSYIVGAVAKKQYTLPPGAFTLYLTRSKDSKLSADQIRVFLATSGADDHRAVILQREDDGIWRVADCTALFDSVMTADR